MNFAHAVNEMLAGHVVTNKNGYGYRIKDKVLEVCASASWKDGWASARTVGFTNSSYFGDLSEASGWKVFVAVTLFRDVAVGKSFTRKKDGLRMEKLKVEGASQYFAKTSDGKVFSVADNEEVNL